jgi:hypothetical protein
VRKLVWMLGCAVLFALGSLPAHAQLDRELSKNWDMRAGFFVPERGISRAAEGDIWFTAGLEREFFFTDRYSGTVSVDYYGSGGIYSIPITVNLRGTTNRLRYGAGAGIALSHDPNGGSTAFTYNLLLGYELTEGRTPLTADVRYRFVNRDGGWLNGWTFTIGSRF